MAQSQESLTNQVLEEEEPPKDNSYCELWGGWLDGTVDYYVNSNVNLVTGGDPIAAIRSSAEAWDIVTTDELFNCAGETAKSWYEEDFQNTVSRVKFIPQDTLAIAVMWYALDTMIIYEVDIVFNTFHNWGIGPVKRDKAYDIQNVATHEFGHPAGLDDLYDRIYDELSMYGYSSKSETIKRSPEDGDKVGARGLYGTP